MPRITVGPVIGKVTNTSGRLLIEVDSDAEITCIATPGSGTAITRTRSFKQNIPAVFSFEDLTPETEYRITFQGLDEAREGRLRTYPANPDALNIAAVSCNFTPMRRETDLWANLRDQYVDPGEINLLLHLGDQIYGDAAFAQAVELVKSNGLAAAGEVRELYRQLYRFTWNHPATRDVLASVPNLMIWDDHEIRDDWGSNETDSEPQTIEHQVGKLARQVYREYQRQLWDDFDTEAEPADGFEYHRHKWGPFGVMFIDLRGGRSFQTDPARPFLGTPQWEAITSWLAGDGYFSDVRALVVVTSVPLAYLGGTISGIGSRFMDDLRDHWSYGMHAKEQIETVRALRVWMQQGAAGGERNVLVIGGDVHIGGYSNIRHLGTTIFTQLITSPITNAPPPFYQFIGLRQLLEITMPLGTAYSVKHSRLTNRRNFGIVIARVPSDGGMPKLDGSLAETV